ncbi:GNAT family N-acetyltransferase [Oscillatoria salina]|uniref:GNAT family N-acetyltransferase n=1 Tax=Oscillatoria salina TaxID=331517 RepID=UPI0013B76AA9|nr:GNAT family N-acetyltransferase [Oscillatoria salina]MBZ8179250.1 N-acetyltransferase [Oscillatoria salina IIICB1]NET89546.1 N-acetyltransferase [Kamptonema sp. SIO1D9]
MTIRNALRSDLPKIVNIYNTAIPDRMATADTEPISLESRLEWFWQHNQERRPLWVFEKQKTIAGWLSFQSFYGRPAYRATAELSIYISPDFQRQGIGKQLLQKAIHKSPSLDIKTLLAFIFAHNQPSLQLFKKFGFTEWGYFPKVAELDRIERDLAILGLRLEKDSPQSYF